MCVVPCCSSMDLASDKLQSCNIFPIPKYETLCDSGISSSPQVQVSGSHSEVQHTRTTVL